MQTTPSHSQTPHGGPVSGQSGLGPTDEALVRVARGGDRAAFGQLVERYGARLLSAVRSRMGGGEGAMDVVQETWVRVARGLGTFREGATFRPWLFAIAFNALRDAGRRESLRAAASVEGEEIQIAVAGDSPTGALAEREAIDCALALVPEPYRSAVHAIDVIGLDHGEAARALDCPPGTLKSRLHRGRRIFCDHYQRLTGADQDTSTKRNRS